MKSIIIGICVSMVASLALAEENAVDYGKSLSAKLTNFQKAMESGSVERQKQALKSMFPTQADMALLFPKSAGILWPKLEAYQNKMVQHIKEVAAEVTRRELTKVEAIDVRKNDGSGRYTEVLKVIPKDIPVFRVIKRSNKGSSGSSSYLFINGRWIHLRGLEMVPEMVKQMGKKQ